MASQESPSCWCELHQAFHPCQPALLAEVDRLRAVLAQTEEHLAAIAESNYAMAGPDIEQLALARGCIEEALE